MNNWKRKTRLWNRFRLKGRRETKGARKVGATRKINCVFEKGKKNLLRDEIWLFLFHSLCDSCFRFGDGKQKFLLHDSICLLTFNDVFVEEKLFKNDETVLLLWVRGQSAIRQGICRCLSCKCKISHRFNWFDLFFHFRSPCLFYQIVYLQLKSPSQLKFLLKMGW